MKPLIAILTVVAAALLPSSLASAGVPTLDVTPNPVAVGGTVTVSGGECLNTANGGVGVHVDGTFSGILATPTAQGDWSAPVPVPAGLVAGDTFTVGAHCDADLVFDYPEVTVMVVAQVSTTAGPTSVGPTTTIAGPQAAPVAPIGAQARFTG